MAPPQRRGGSGGGGEGRGKGGGRGGGGRGARGGGRGGRGAGANAEAASEAPAPAPEAGGGGGGGARSAKSKPPRKSGGSGTQRSGGAGAGGGSAPGRPARAVSVVTRKVLIRNIPHDWDEDKVMELVEAHGVMREHMWRFVVGKVRSNNRAPRPGRLYLDFKRDAELAKSVIDKLHGYAVSDNNDDAPLDVDFAPFQKISREKQRKDAKAGTIDRDADFVAFLEALAKPKEKLPSADVAAEAKDMDGGAEKPVAALVQFLNERKRDKKGKFGGKGAEKSRSARAKSAKEGKGIKEKTKGAKGKAKAAEGTTKETAKPRKTRGKVAKEKSGEAEQVEPGAIKIMGSKTRENSSTRLETKSAAPSDAAGSEASGATSKAKPGKGSGNKAPRNRASQTGPKEQLNETAPADAAGANTKEMGPKAGGRVRRDSRAGKGPKGGGRGDQPKKVFAPKVTTPAG